MNKNILSAFLFSSLATFTACNKHMEHKYPDTKKDVVEEEYFGTKVADPYRWLEDDKSSETAEWVAAENEVTQEFLSKIPFKKGIQDRLTELWNYEKITAPRKHGEWLYFYKNDGLQNQYVLYRKKPNSEVEEIFLDPNSFSEDGTTSLSTIKFTPDGKLAAYATSTGGSDWRDIYVIDTKTKEIVEAPVKNAKFSNIAWKKNEGFYYSKYDQPKDGSQLSGMTQHHKLMYHKMGTPQKEDKLVFGGIETPRRYVGAYVTDDQQYLVITAAVNTTGNELYIQDLSKKNAPIITLVDNFDNNHSIIYSDKKQFWIETNYNAPNGKVVVAKVNAPERAHWNDLIPETENVLSVSTSGKKIFAKYMKDAISKVYQYDLKGKKEKEVVLPGVGTASGFYGEDEDKTLFYTFTSYTMPSTTFEYNIKTGESKEYIRPNVKFNPNDYTSEQVFYASKDGTKVPMIITYKKGLKKDGQNPTILYGYGGFSVSLQPSFSVANVVWLENGGVYAVPNLRGGGEYGEKWHLAGTKMKKQNVFDDFIAAAEYLKKEGYTSTEKLAIRGGSNGGLLVGATMTQRPDLAAVAFPAVGVLDMLRYNKFTAGAGWAYDYGTAEDSKEMFEYLKGYSPYHNVKQGVAYPSTLITTADHDDRVVPAHSFKFAAELQAKDAGKHPVLIRIATNAGHGAGKPTSMIIEEYADIFGFAWYNMNVTPGLNHKVDSKNM
ncbi:prolyl oligopeptidase family serine peptidase [Flammeovirga pacifica]|uniref:prolyl oligopeptidase n=1 Tax=Flammeovirga pacifica TaxID=915059 RepID=A0A1S1Z5B2_FLAPC|nr:prolyl oligopeptidase family serine peptidase [Flammeovirga pacifica]OHX68407.1 S9 family peptidase [Flammeovirga pacifica]